MPDNNPQNKMLSHPFEGITTVEECLNVAHIHHREADQLFEGAQQALAEDRQEEARLLTDLAVARRARGEEFERAARGEIGDPIVAEIREFEPEMIKNYTPNTPTYSAPEVDLPPEWLAEMKRPPLGPIARAMAWIGSWISP
jgi:acyl-CoA reductase-like NAD-dependent aldehyde dehydrogenase